jgi:hypothetical protein
MRVRGGKGTTLRGDQTRNKSRPPAQNAGRQRYIIQLLLWLLIILPVLVGATRFECSDGNGFSSRSIRTGKPV